MPTFGLYQTYEPGDPRREASIAMHGDGVYGDQFQVSVTYGGIGHNVEGFKTFKEDPITSLKMI